MHKVMRLGKFVLSNLFVSNKCVGKSLRKLISKVNRLLSVPLEPIPYVGISPQKLTTSALCLSSPQRVNNFMLLYTTSITDIHKL